MRRSAAVALFVLSFSRVVGKIREIDYSDKIVYTDISDEYIRKNSITVDPAGAAARRRTNEYEATTEDVENLAWRMRSPPPPEEPASTGESPPPEEQPTSEDSTPRGSLRATLRRLGVAAPASDDEATLTQTLQEKLKSTPMTLLRGLLFERGARCVGPCTEKEDFIAAVLSSLSKPLVARHSLPLFLFNQPLFPHTEIPLHLFEPRYKILCRKALKAERLFGFVVGDVGTLARITRWSFSDDDAADGSCNLKVTGLRRFRLGRQWQDQCAGCNTGPLHYADVVYFNDTAKLSEQRIAKGVANVKESLRLHHSLLEASAQRELEERIGPPPTVRDMGFAMSFWLAGACPVFHQRCQGKLSSELLASTSTADRVEKILTLQRSLGGARFSVPYHERK